MNGYKEAGDMYKKYGFLNALFDIFMICITGGAWVIWVVVRYLRTH